jgi:hypothetical protein
MDGDLPMAASQLHDDVITVADPQKRGRQYLTSYLARLAGTRMAGFVLTRQEAIGKWGKATYALKRTSQDGNHRGHGGHRGESQAPNGANEHADERSDDAMTPMTPMPSAAAQQTVAEKHEPLVWRGRL